MATSDTRSPYIPSFIKAALENSKPVQLTFSEIQHTNIQSTASFLYDPNDAPLKNTQQLNVDWSKFENHTFFASAEAKVNLAFDQIINGFPFDGSKAEIENFFDNITGFDKWVFDKFPKFKGQLKFDNSYIRIKDFAGSLYPDISKNKTGESILNPRNDVSFTIESQIYLPEVPNDNQVIFQKSSEIYNHGISLVLVSTGSTTLAPIYFIVTSGSTSIVCGTEIRKGTFNHVCATLNREFSVNKVDFFVNEKLVNSSDDNAHIGELNIDTEDILIGSGSTISIYGAPFTPNELFNGTLDELRVFHSVRTIEQQKLYSKKSIYSTPELKLYYKFNEPNSQLSTNVLDDVNKIVLDSSGNSLHALISGYDVSLRQDASLDPLSNMLYEKPETLTVLFPGYSDVIALNDLLIEEAIEYDKSNPNLITKLIPQHYLLEAKYQDGFDTTNQLSNQNMPGQNQLAPAQVITSFLFIWSRFFDEMKLFLDAFSTLNKVSYDAYGNSPTNFLHEMVKNYGFYMPPLLNDSTIDQYVNAENIGNEIATSAHPLKHVQNELMKRVLINMPGVIRSKGTQHAIKSFLRSVGIDPENTLRIREYGGSTSKTLSFARERKYDSATMVKFLTSSLAITPPLSASRVEIGFPEPRGTMVDVNGEYGIYGISDNTNDGLLTSGSWTCEGIYKYIPNSVTLVNSTQSLMRLCVDSNTTTQFVTNLLALSGSTTTLELFVRPGSSLTSPLLKLQLDLPTGSLFNDTQRWNISFGRERNDSINSNVSSSYFLRAASQAEGDITWFGETKSYFQDAPLGETNVFEEMISNVNNDGVTLAIGENHSILSGSVGYQCLNDTSVCPPESRTTTFSGLASNVRFWSKAITNDEFKEHVRNYKSLGVHDPKTHYNFITTPIDSWGKIRVDTLKKQDERTTQTGNITFLDFSLNDYHMSGSGFSTSDKVIIGELFDYSYLSPYYDEAATDEKIRVRGYINPDLVDTSSSTTYAPVYELEKSERPTDDTRMSIEFSLIDALNRDIVTMFSTFDAIDNAIGSPELVYSPDYPDLEILRNIYFNRISEKLNFKNFFEFYKWFDSSIGTFIEQLVPRKTRFKGINFTVESHVLERNKLEYLSSEMYLGDSQRSRIRDVLLVQQIVGSLRKY